MFERWRRRRRLTRLALRLENEARLVSEPHWNEWVGFIEANPWRAGWLVDRARKLREEAAMTDGTAQGGGQGDNPDAGGTRKEA